MRRATLLRHMHSLQSWARLHQLLLVTLAGVALLLAIGLIDHVSAASRRSDILFLVQVGGLTFLVVYVIATNRIAQANQLAAQATVESAHVARQAVDAAARSLQVSEAMLAEAKATRLVQELQSAPRVVVFAEMEGLTWYLAVENTGLSFANEVTVTFTPPLPSTAFLKGFTPDFFTGAVFTLRPGEKIHQPLDQTYQPISRETADVPLTATARYRGGVLAEEVVETFPINLTGFDNLLVTSSDIELALHKLGKLVTAVEHTGEAVKAVSTRLDESVLVSTILLQAPSDAKDEAIALYFGWLISGLSDEWHLWQKLDRSQHYMRRPMKRRIKQLLEAAHAALPHLLLADEDTRQCRTLFFDIQAALTYPYAGRDFDEEGIISHSLAELTEIAKHLASPGTAPLAIPSAPSTPGTTGQAPGATSDGDARVE